MKTAALIGISNYARHHLLMVLEQALHGRVRLVGATVVNGPDEVFFSNRLRAIGCELFDHVDAMWERLRGRVDLCFIPTGIHLHAAMTLQALSAGACVLVEKPLATSVADARAIQRLEQETGRFVAVGFQDLYTESTWAIKRLLLDGGIGRLQAISFAGLWPRPTTYYQRNNWAGRLRHDGRTVFDSPVSNAFAHFFNLALFWAGNELAKPAKVEHLACELYRVQPIESFDTCCVHAALSGGVELRAYATHSCSDDRVPSLRLDGSRGSIEWVQESHYNVIPRRGARTRHPVPGKFETKFMMADAVLSRFEDPAARICDTTIAIEHTRLVEAVHAIGTIVDVSPAHVRRRQSSAGEWREIEGIESAIDTARARGRMFSALAVPWAHSAAPPATPGVNGRAAVPRARPARA